MRAQHYRWDDMPKEELSSTIGRKIISGEKAMVAQVFLAKGAVVPRHEHVNEQITWILEGALELTLGDEDDPQVEIVRAGEVLLIPANLPHSAVALEDTLDVDLFAPPRQDWLDKSDDYLRG